MKRLHRVTLLTSLALVVTSCDDRQQSTAPLAAVAQAGLLDAIAPQGAAQDDRPVSATSLTLPFSGSYSGIPAAFEISQTGLGRAGVFQNTSSTNPRVALTAQTAGTSNALYVNSTGTGIPALFEITRLNNNSPVLRLQSAGLGRLLEALSTSGSPAIYASNSVSGTAGYFTTTSAYNVVGALTAYAVSAGYGLWATNGGTGTGAYAQINNVNNINPALLARTNGLGSAGSFEITSSSNTDAVVRAVTSGTGTVLIADHKGTAGSIAVFQSNSLSQARIDRDGRGFFNGGTQNNGADVAEAFEVEGSVTGYRRGDVLVISTRSDQRVTRSTEPYSTRVIGVYATKPGVLLSERGIDESLDDFVPVGVIGVIPTRVSAENGAIKRGDILVTARTPGHAMRATPNEVNGVKLYPSGAILGKALQNFAGPGTGIIKVLVNVK